MFVATHSVNMVQQTGETAAADGPRIIKLIFSKVLYAGACGKPAIEQTRKPSGNMPAVTNTARDASLATCTHHTSLLKVASLNQRAG